MFRGCRTGTPAGRLRSGLGTRRKSRCNRDACAPRSRRGANAGMGSRANRLGAGRVRRLLCLRRLARAAKKETEGHALGESATVTLAHFVDRRDATPARRPSTAPVLKIEVY